MAQEEVPEEHLAKMGWEHGGRTYRWPSGFNKLWETVKLLRFAAPYCERCDGNHAQFFLKGQEKPMICPEEIFVCPCGCGNGFAYNKKEQEKLREKFKVGN